MVQLMARSIVTIELVGTAPCGHEIRLPLAVTAHYGPAASIPHGKLDERLDELRGILVGQTPCPFCNPPPPDETTEGAP